MGWFSDDVGTNTSNEDCTERDCAGANLVGEQGQHFRYQCGSDRVEGYGNTNEEKSSSGGGFSNAFGKAMGNLFGGWV